MGMELQCSDCVEENKHEVEVEFLVWQEQKRLQASFCCPLCDAAGDLFTGRCVACESIVCHECILGEKCSDCQSLHGH